MTLDPVALDHAARTYAAAEGWHYADHRPTGPEHLDRAANIIRAYLDRIDLEDDQPIGTRFRIDLPYDRPPAGLSGNARGNAHYSKSRDTKRVRADVTRLAQDAGLVRCAHLTVALLWAPGDRRKRDEDNLWPLLKVCCDALAKGPRADWVGLDLVPDDTRRYMTKQAPVILTPDETTETGLWLEIDAVGEPVDDTRSVRSRPPRADEAPSANLSAANVVPAQGHQGTPVRRSTRAPDGIPALFCPELTPRQDTEAVK